MKKSPYGWPPTADHFREVRCGRHRHMVCDRQGCTTHYDQWNPECEGEMLPHLRDDFMPAHGQWVVPLLAIGFLGGLALLLAD